MLIAAKVLGIIVLVVGLLSIAVRLLFWAFNFDTILPTIDEEAD